MRKMVIIGFIVGIFMLCSFDSYASDQCRVLENSNSDFRNIQKNIDFEEIKRSVKDSAFMVCYKGSTDSIKSIQLLGPISKARNNICRYGITEIDVFSGKKYKIKSNQYDPPTMMALIPEDGNCPKWGAQSYVEVIDVSPGVFIDFFHMIYELQKDPRKIHSLYEGKYIDSSKYQDWFVNRIKNQRYKDEVSLLEYFFSENIKNNYSFYVRKISLSNGFLGFMAEIEFLGDLYGMEFDYYNKEIKIQFFGKAIVD